MTGLHWAEEPVSRVSHLVGNISAAEQSVPGLPERVSDETDCRVGRRKDTLRKVGDSWQVSRRELLLDPTVLLTKNLSIFV
jgi:3-phenylpropionate/cinnamic acid dioxygenase small subunit